MFAKTKFLNAAGDDANIDLQQQITQLIESDEFKSQIKEETEQLSKDADSLDASFKIIEGLIVRIGEEAEKAGAAELSQAATNLTPAWGNIKERFDGLLARSRKIAGDAEVTLEDVIKVIIPVLLNKDISTAQKISEVAGYRTMLDTDSAHSHELAAGFEDLGKEVNDFMNNEWPRLQQSAQASNPAGRDNEEKEKLKDEVAKLSRQIAAVRFEIFKFTKLVKSQKDLVYGSAQILRALAGKTMTRMAIRAARRLHEERKGLAEFENKMRQLEGKLEGLEEKKNDKIREQAEKIEEARKRGEAFETAQRMIEAGQTELDNIAEKLPFLQEVWNAIINELAAIQSALELDPGSKIFAIRLSGTIGHFRALSLLLRAFQVGAPVQPVEGEDVEAEGDDSELFD